MTTNRIAKSAANEDASTKASGEARARQLSFVVEMLRELRAISASAETETLIYLLDMAILEAADRVAALKDEAA
jgi:hypothetical protein